MNKKLKIALITIVSFLSAIILLIIITLAVIVSSDDYVRFDECKLKAFSSRVVILDVNGQPINETLLINNAKNVDITLLNQYTLDAFISIEDKRFYSHNGVDVRSILRALKNNISSRSIKEGASTISQQLIKNTHLNNDKTIKRKVNEIILARRLESQYSKKEILQMYLNTIYFGGNAYGIEVASNLYFDKSASELTLSQSAMLAGIIQSPNNYSPFTDINKCISRRNTVLGAMLTQSLITQEQYDTALLEHIDNSPRSTIKQQDYADAVIYQACQILGVSPMQLTKSELVIHTYLDQNAQDSLIDSINRDTSTTQSGAPAQKSALVLDNNTCGVSAYYCLNAFDFLRQHRQIGSTAKTFAVYAPALECKAITLVTPILDEKTDFNGYSPDNYNNSYLGWTTIKRAFANSSNACATSILNSIGIAKSQEYSAKLGIRITDADDNLTLALGNYSQGVDILTLASAYSTFARQGNICNASLIKSIHSQGRCIYQHQTNNQSVYSPDTAFLSTQLLISAVQEGTARGLSSLPYQVACKTGTVGTTISNSDAISVGYTSQHTFCVWISDTDSNLAPTLLGGGAPTIIAKDILTHTYVDYYPEDFVQPNSVAVYQVDSRMLKDKHIVALAGKSRDYMSEYFSRDNAPITIDIKDDIVKLSLVRYDNSIIVNMSSELPQYRLYRINNDNATLLSNDCSQLNGKYMDKSLTEGSTYTYFLTRVIDTKEILCSNKVTVTIPFTESTTEQTEPDQNKGWWRSFIEGLTG